MLYLTTVGMLSVSAHGHGRALSYANILQYMPGSQVTDHANIDLDQAALESALSSVPSGYATAKAIYTTGGHSKPTAVCQLQTPLVAAVSKKAAVSFVTNNGHSTVGKAYAAYSASDTSISFTYPVSESRVQPASTACYQGALPASSQKTAGCIAATAGVSNFTIGTTTYLATCTNRGKRTLQGFSTKAKALMNDCPTDASVGYANGCPYTSYKPYYDYYGDYAYADTLVLAALDGTKITSFANGGMDFTGVADAARVDMIKKGTSYMNTWMYVLREFEDAIDDCKQGDLTANALSSGPVHAWDEGVAFYTGSDLTVDDMLAGNLAGLDSRGKMPYTLANKRCRNFVTCGPDGDARIGEAKANVELFDLFAQGQRQLLVGACDKVVPIKNAIVPKMTIPLVQGALRYAFKVAALSGGDKEKGEGAIFAAAVLPQLHACDSAAATTVYTNMNINAGSTDFTAVKAALEGCYASMGITCADVGGLWDAASTAYYNVNGNDASPCVDAQQIGTNVLIAVAVGAALVLILLVCICVLVGREKSGKPIFKGVEAPSGAKGTDMSSAA